MAAAYMAIAVPALLFFSPKNLASGKVFGEYEFISNE